MTDDTIPMPAGEEPAKPTLPEARTPGVDEMPTAMLTSTAPEDVTQTMATEVPADGFSTADDAMQALPIGTPAAAPTVQAVPSQAYGQNSAPTEVVPPAPYAIPPIGAQPQPGDPAVFSAQGAYPAQPLPVQGAYAQYPDLTPQPGMPYPGAPVPVAKKRRPLLWVIIVIVVVLLVGGGTVFAIVARNTPTNTPTQALQQFCHGYQTLNAHEVYGTLSTKARANASEAQLQQAFDLLKSMSNLVKISGCTVGSIQQNGSTATSTITITATVSLLGTSTSSSNSLPMSLVLENNTWKIDTTSTAAPNFTAPTFPSGIPTPTPANS